MGLLTLVRAGRDPEDLSRELRWSAKLGSPDDAPSEAGAKIDTEESEHAVLDGLQPAIMVRTIAVVQFEYGMGSQIPDVRRSVR